MPFGLCNAPAMFQALMNDVLRPFLRRFVLVFFDDILIYTTTWTDHLRHVRAILNVLLQHRLFVKRSKCEFSANSISYLGHIISATGITMDPAKVQAVADWPIPKSTRVVRGFLGLTVYYRKFVKGVRVDRCAPHGPSPQGGVRLVRRGRRGVHGAQDRSHHSARARAARFQ